MISNLRPECPSVRALSLVRCPSQGDPLLLATRSGPKRSLATYSPNTYFRGEMFMQSQF
jgi:hypothetical protein